MEDEGERRWRQAPGKLSEVLEELATSTSSERLSAGELLDGFGERAFGILIFVFAVPNFMPLGLPGTSAMLGIPLAFLTAQMMIGSSCPSLPGKVRALSVRRAYFAAVIRRILPWLRCVERVIRPRLLRLSGRTAERAIGAAGFVLAATISLPIPFGNALPAFTLAALAVGLVERDGIVVAVGGILTILSFAVTAAVLYGVVHSGRWLFEATI